MINPETLNVLTLPSLPLEQRSQLPEVPGIYFNLDELDQIQYIGRAINIRSRWLYHHQASNLDQMGGTRIVWLEVSDPNLLPEIEAALIAWFRPPLNKQLYDSKSSKDTIKVVLPKSLKRWFKGVCVSTDNEMSAIMTDLVESWCLGNDCSMTVAKLIQLNLETLDKAKIPNLDALMAGEKPTEFDLVKLSRALGMKTDTLIAIAERSFDKH